MLHGLKGAKSTLNVETIESRGAIFVGLNLDNLANEIN